MPSLNTVLVLARQMPKSTKRKFTLNIPAGDKTKSYYQLYTLFEKLNYDEKAIRKKYCEKNTSIHLNNSLQYLYKLLLQTLLTDKTNEEIENKIELLYNEAGVLFENKLFKPCFETLKKAKKLAATYEKNTWHLLILKREREYHRQLQYQYTEEKELIKLQQKTSSILQKENTYQNLYGLYELIHYRFIHSGQVRNESEKTKLNDLVVNEMNIINQPSSASFDSQKIHLQFQTIYFKMIGDYKSSLRTCFELNQLYENNRDLWINSPLFYIQHLKEMLTILKEINRLDELGYFLNRLFWLMDMNKNLEATIFPIIYVFQLYEQLNRGSISEAVKLLNKLQPQVELIQHKLKLEDKLEIILVQVTVFFKIHDYKKICKLLSPYLQLRNRELPVYRILRIINLISFYQLKDFEYVEYEIKSFKRELIQKENFYKTEQILFRFLIKMTRYTNILTRKNELKNRFITEIQLLKNNPFEQQLLRQFDFISWAENL